jgi:hypothetical protein
LLRRIAVALSAITVLTGVGLTASPAMAQVSASGRSPSVAVGFSHPHAARYVSPLDSSDFYICLSANNNECLTGNGTGNQMTIESDGFATWTYQDTSGGTGVYKFVDLHGNCIREGSDNEVKVESCNQGDHNEWWAQGGSSPDWSLTNYARDNTMSTTNDNDGDKVWGGDNTYQLWSYIAA